MNEFFELAKSVGNISGTGSIILILYILYRDGVIRFGKNGKNGKNLENGKNNVYDVQAALTTIRDNHLHELKEGQTEILHKLDKLHITLEALDKYGIKIRKE